MLNDIREEAMQQESAFTRYHLAAKKNLANIMSYFGVSEVQRHPDDQESVRPWIEQWKMSESNPVLFHKFQGESAPDGHDLTKDEFMIVTHSPFQKEMAQKFSSNGICVAATMELLDTTSS